MSLRHGELMNWTLPRTTPLRGPCSRWHITAFRNGGRQPRAWWSRGHDHQEEDTR